MYDAGQFVLLVAIKDILDSVLTVLLNTLI